MDIRLRTNTDNTTFKLLDCRALDEEHFECFLVVRSGPFQAHTSFWFDRASLRSVIDCLKVAGRSQASECRLTYTGERQFVAFRGNGRGYVTVSGLLAQDGAQCQCLRFELPVASASLEQLVADLEYLADDYSFRLCPETGFGSPAGYGAVANPVLPMTEQFWKTGGDCDCRSGNIAAAMLEGHSG